MTFGQLHERDELWQLEFTRKLAHPPEKVWRALTQFEDLAAWFPTTIEGERAPGAVLRFSFRNEEAPAFSGEMVTYDPFRLLEFMWGPDRLRFELHPEAGGTVLTLVDTLEAVGKAARDAAGWHQCLDALELDLAGAPVPRPYATNRWKEVHPVYVHSFGPDASAIGPPEGFDGNE
jgi:uncharacterized protein YndB with AHSA1/START domain